MTDGHVNKCKECNKADVRKNRLDNLEYYRSYDIKRSKKPKRIKAIAKTSRNWAKRFPQKRMAINAVNNAVRDGRLNKPDSCDRCSKQKRLHGHHDDYSKPLDVMWLCVPCHHARHKELN